MAVHGHGLLRPLDERDLEQMLQWRNSDHVRQYSYHDEIITWEQHVNWFRGIKDNSSFKGLIFELEGIPTGVMNFTNIDKRHGRGYWGFYIGRPDTPRGTGTTLCELAVEYAFEKLSIRKLCGEVLAHNQASIALHRKLDFVQEGCFSKHVWKNGSYVDVICYAKFNPNYNEEVRSIGRD